VALSAFRATSPNASTPNWRWPNKPPVAQENQQIEDELKMARELQLAMLPQNFPAISAAQGKRGTEISQLLFAQRRGQRRFL